MAFEIAKQKGCEVKGISLSKNQIKYCKDKAKELSLDNQVSFELADYREINGQYDRIYSVGMFEHVGKKFYKAFFESINKLLKDDGIFLLHTFGVVDKPSPPNKFINKSESFLANSNLYFLDKIFQLKISPLKIK